MDEFVLDDVLATLRASLERGDLDGAVAAIQALLPADQADLVEGLSGEDQLTLLAQLDPADSADVLEEMEDREAAALAEILPLIDLAGILDEMEVDEAADVLGDLSPERAADALRVMEESGEVLPLLQYPDDTAGGLMTPAIVTLRRRWRAVRALEELRRVEPDADSAYYLFVTDEQGELLGVVSLRNLVVAAPETTVEAMMDPNAISVSVHTDQEDCARILSRYGFLALPVVDDENRLVGVITADDLIEVAENEATEDMYRLVGISGEERVFSPVRLAVLKRLPWLAINMLTLFVAITVVDAFDQIIAGMVALATFLPLVSGEGGNAGSQTTTILVRGLALGEVDSHAAPRIVGKEVGAALINGTAIGLGTGAAIYAWKGEWVISVAVALAMVLNFVMAALSGVLVPLGLKALKVDPAVASAAFVTAITDTLGFLFFLGIATLLL
ncbi:MAG: magnesium transporter [Anaerolineae bacterium]|nr:magnesium transporter [Anaerolineae bacterium]